MAVAVACAVLLAGGVAAAEPVRFAVVIGNNHSSRPGTRDLRYADDDAVAMHELLRQAGVESALFATLDVESRELYPDLVTDGRPRWSALRARLDRMEEQIRAAERAGAATTLLIFYSGHGDVANGEGYVELEDARLSRSLLRSRILEPTAASEVHLIIDACRSYFLAFEKGAGGRRRAAAALPISTGTRARIGYILSTSSDRESHEWEAFQGGIFSHEVRSALRGAADADRDGRVTYAEVGAFLSVANRGIRNARFRPDFVVRPPDDLSDELLRWGPEVQSLLLDVPGQGHMVIEGPGGERVVDVHPASDESLVVYLPKARPLFVRPSNVDLEFAITASMKASEIRLSRTSFGRVRIASKGALHLAFSQLFSSPFGAVDVERYRQVQARALAAEELEADLTASLGDRGRDRGGSGRRIAGGLAIGAGVAGLGLAGWAIERSIAAGNAPQTERADRNGTIEDLRLAAGLSLGVAATSSLVYVLLGRSDPPAETLTVAPSAGPDGSYAVALIRAW